MMKTGIKIFFQMLKDKFLINVSVTKNMIKDIYQGLRRHKLDHFSITDKTHNQINLNL